MSPQRFTLDNGLRVLIEENHSAKVVALEAWVDVGSASETQDIAGIAHVFEHMLFKGTKRRAVGEIARDVEGAGGDINAWTSFDETVFHLVMPSRHFERGLDILADALQNSAFDPNELERELKVVLEELKQGEDNPGRVASQTLFGTAYTKHTYRRPVIGSAKTVKALTRDKLVAFFEKHYVAKNITLVLCGDLDPGKAKKLVEKMLGGMPSGAARVDQAPVEPPQKAPRAKVVTADVREAQLQLAFHVPSVKQEDAPALELIALVLGHGESSRLDTILRREREAVNDVFAYAYSPRDPGLFVLGASTRPAEVNAALDGLLEQAFRLGREPITDEELARARAIVEADTIYGKETMQGRARKAGYFEALGMGGTGEAVYLHRIATLTPDEIMNVAKAYFTPDGVSIALVAPASNAPTAEKLVARIQPIASRADKRAVVARGDRTVEVKLPSGAKLIVVPDRGSGLVAMRAVFLGGQRYEDARRAGIGNLLAALLTRGTRTRTGDELSREVEGLAGSLGGFSGRNTFGVAGEFLSSHAERALELLADCVQHPAFREAEIERERRRVLEQLRTEADHPSIVAFRMFHEALFPKHPYRLPLSGDAQSVAGLTRRALTDWHARYMQPEQMVLTIVGDVDPDAVAELAARLFPKAGGRAVDAPKPAIDAVRTDGPREVFHGLDKRQAHFVYGFPGTTLTSRDRFGLELLATVLGGQSGRLFVELRDKRGLAYRVSASSLDGVDPGYFAVYMATSPENLTVAVAGIEDELAKLRDKRIPDEELERAKRYLIGAHEISLQRRSSLAATIAFHVIYGVGVDGHERYADEIERWTSADLQKLARTYLERDKAVIATVRPDEKSPALSKKAELPKKRARR